ncbi:MAG: beta-lactamase family protein [Acidobacteria bacterium]|nr:beta-lactamase family protein [Acidobacteriota bacterium]
MRLPILLPLFLASITLSAQVLPARAPADPTLTLDRKRIEAALAQMTTAGRAAGTSLLIWKDGGEAYYGAAGFADREGARAMSRDTIAQIYSMTKPVTGVALMQLWEQGKFSLDDPLAAYLPEFQATQVYAGNDASGAPSYRAPTRPISVRDILRHTAGFAYGPGATPAHKAFVAANPLALDIDLAEMGRRLARVPLLFDPGTRWGYSIAVDVQALLVEKLAGVPFAAYVQQHILQPLGMRDTAWRQPEDRLPRFAAAYRKSQGKLARIDDATASSLNFAANRLTPGGHGLASTLDDYMRFARMLLGEGELDGVRILKPSTVRLMATDHLEARITDRGLLANRGAFGFGFDFAVRTAQPRTPAEARGARGEFCWVTGAPGGGRHGYIRPAGKQDG